jgi:hypothetical protein
MRDRDIRTVLIATLAARHAGDTDTLIRHEVGLCAGNRRVDVAVINGEIAGWEIKSDEDTLLRLSGQASVYAKVLDRATLVTTAKYIAKADALLPDWWALVVAEQRDANIQLTNVRDGQLNASTDAFSIAQLLWREEALDELRQRQLSRGLAKKARYYVWERLAASLGGDELRQVVRRRLRARVDWPGGRTPWPDDDSSRTLATV